MFSPQDLEQLARHGLSPETAHAQLRRSREGFPFFRLEKPCVVGDGIRHFSGEEAEALVEVGRELALSGRTMKFVPASGAASRMFRSLLAVSERHGDVQLEAIRKEAGAGVEDGIDFLRFAEGIRSFAFCDDLQNVLERSGQDLDALVDEGRFGPIILALLGTGGLDYASRPKGLIKFHSYAEQARTAIEEHLVEALAYSQDREGQARVHFTFSPQHLDDVKRHVAEVLGLCEPQGAEVLVGLSVQKPSTDTIAATLENVPFRDAEDRLVFRPAGHGALLENLNELGGDIVFIKNIDNVAPDYRKAGTYASMRLLAGHLGQLQKGIRDHLEALDESGGGLEAASEFCATELSMELGASFGELAPDEKRDFLRQRLDRPLRVCGMVRNEGEPGGGPFWVRGDDGSLSLQIVESSQVDMGDEQQRCAWESSTHHNPVCIVCGVRDPDGRPYDLTEFADPSTGMIATKSKGGRELKAMELPGLWNGSMAKWNTVFVEIPISAFSPVKTVLDLLRDSHQPAQA